MRFEDLEERKIAIKDLAVVSVGGRGSIERVNVNKNGDSMIVEDVYVGPPVVADQSPVDDAPWTVDLETGEVAKAEVTPVDPPTPEDANPFDPSKSEAKNIRIALSMYRDETNKSIIEILNRYGVDVSSSQVTRERKAIAKAADETESSE
jgi:hypothetical protein